MKNLILRAGLLEKNHRVYNLAESLGIADSTLSRWLRTEWPTELQERAIKCVDADSDEDPARVRQDIYNIIRKKSGDPNGYASRVLREVEELELRRQTEREEWD